MLSTCDNIDRLPAVLCLLNACSDRKLFVEVILHSSTRELGHPFSDEILAEVDPPPPV